MKSYPIRTYQICSRCIMDTSARNISFDESGVCNFCTNFLNGSSNRRLVPEAERQTRLKKLRENIKKTSGKKYDCIIGVSGGLDSTYAVHLAKQLGLNPLAVHLDNGWNSEAATNNIRTVLSALGVDLYTHVIDWEEFKDLQRSFFDADVVAIELLTDHAILALLYKVASKHKVSYILTGINNSTEGMAMPWDWNHFKFDDTNIRGIHKIFGKKRRIKTFPYMSLFKYSYYRYIKKITLVEFLDYFDYNKTQATKLLVEKYGFKTYQSKHYENIFTRFYQACILPKKFKIDKRHIHFSNLICTNQMTREEALREMQKPVYACAKLETEDYQYVLKKLEFSPEEFTDYLCRPPIHQRHYPSNFPFYRKLRRLLYGY